MPPIESKQFIEDGTAAVTGFRRALADILAEVGCRPDRSRELSRKLGLDKTLTWRVSRFVTEEDAWAAVPHIPRRPSIRIFVDAMAKHGASDQSVTAVLEALDEFERFVETHSGDRETLEVMAGAGASGVSAKRLAAFQKSAYQANSGIWGVSAKVQYSICLMAPSAAKPDMVDLGIITGFVGLRRLRPDRGWAVGTIDQWDHQYASADAPVVPLDPESLVNGVPVLPRFCSSPLPPMRLVKGQGDQQRIELERGEIGNAGACDVVLGWKWPATASMYESTPNERGELGIHLSTPVESSILDVFVHKSMGFAMRPEAGLYSELPADPSYPSDGGRASPLAAATDIIRLGTADADIATSDVPEYGEIVRFGAEKMGIAPGEFSGFRYRLRYPPIPTIAIMKHPLLRR
jgi:hypothetical protein